MKFEVQYKISRNVLVRESLWNNASIKYENHDIVRENLEFVV